MSQNSVEKVEHLHECPKCGKRSLAQRGSGRYECIWCDFSRDLSRREQSAKTNSGVGGLFLGAVTMIWVIVWLFGALGGNSPEPATAEDLQSSQPMGELRPQAGYSSEAIVWPVGDR